MAGEKQLRAGGEKGGKGIVRMQAVIIAGGLGTRLRPLTLEIPKSMVMVNGRPFIEHKILLLKKYGVNDFLFCIGYLGEHFEKYFLDGSKLGVKIKYSVEKTPLGTGGALKNAEEKLEDNFIAINGDTYLPIDYKKLMDFYCEKKKNVIVLYDNHEKIAENNITLGKDCLVSAYNKDSSAGMKYVDAGVCVFNKSVLSHIPQGKKVSLEKEIFPKLIEQKQLAGYVTNQRFFDMGTPERLKKTEEFLR
jgi:NDP-sugar pyrophosphorylase family protein